MWAEGMWPEELQPVKKPDLVKLGPIVANKNLRAAGRPDSFCRAAGRAEMT